MDVFDIFRLANIVVAIVTIGIYGHLARDAFRGENLPAATFVMGVLVWCVGYLAAAVFSTYSEPNGPSGPWTAVMSAPLGFSFISGAWLLQSHRLARRRG